MAAMILTLQEGHENGSRSDWEAPYSSSRQKESSRRILGSRWYGDERLLSDDEKCSWWRVWQTENIGPVSFFNLLRKFGSIEHVLDRLPHLLGKRGTTPSLEVAQREYDRAQKLGVRLLGYSEPGYPQALRMLPDAPPLLYVQGRAELLGTSCLGMIGSRQASLTGRRMAEILAYDLGKRGFTIVSGMAKGIDACAHHAALDTGTIAVVAGGIDTLYPPENRALWEEIKEKGLLVSEVRLGEVARGVLFPRRNRIISGLCWGLVVVEAGLKSGSLVTARYALDQGRSIFAVPGHPLDPRSHGVNHLIRQGAKLTESAQDICDEAVDTLGERQRVLREAEDRQANSWGAPAESCGLWEEIFYESSADEPCSDIVSEVVPIGTSSRISLDEDAAEAGAGAGAGAGLGEGGGRGKAYRSWSTDEIEKDHGKMLLEQVEEALGSVPAHPQELARLLGCSETRIHIAIVELELEGRVERSPGGGVIRALKGRARRKKPQEESEVAQESDEE